MTTSPPLEGETLSRPQRGYHMCASVRSLLSYKSRLRARSLKSSHRVFNTGSLNKSETFFIQHDSSSLLATFLITGSSFGQNECNAGIESTKLGSRELFFRLVALISARLLYFFTSVRIDLVLSRWLRARTNLFQMSREPLSSTW